MNDLTQPQNTTSCNSQEPYLHGDVDGNLLSIHAGTTDDDLSPTVLLEVDQIGKGASHINIRTSNAVSVAADLCTAAGLPAHSMRAAALAEAARIADAMDAPAVAAELRRLVSADQ